MNDKLEARDRLIEDMRDQSNASISMRHSTMGGTSKEEFGRLNHLISAKAKENKEL